MVEAWAVFTLVLFGDVKTDSGVISLFVQFTWISVNAYKPEFKLKKKGGSCSTSNLALIFWCPGAKNAA